MVLLHVAIYNLRWTQALDSWNISWGFEIKRPPNGKMQYML